MNNLLPALYIIIGGVCACIGMFIHDRGKAKKERKDELERKVYSLEQLTARLEFRLTDRTSELDEEIADLRNKISKHLTENNKGNDNE